MAKPHYLEISFYPTTSSPVYKTPEILPPLFSSISCPETLNMFQIFKFSFPLFFKKGGKHYSNHENVKIHTSATFTKTKEKALPAQQLLAIGMSLTCL